MRVVGPYQLHLCFNHVTSHQLFSCLPHHPLWCVYSTASSTAAKRGVVRPGRFMLALTATRREVQRRPGAAAAEAMIERLDGIRGEALEVLQRLADGQQARAR